MEWYHVADILIGMFSSKQMLLKSPPALCRYELKKGELAAGCFFMPPPLGAGGIMFSGCPSVRLSVRPSVRSLKYPLLTCTWVRWSTRPTVTVLRHVRPSVRPSVRLSVRPERFPGICRRMHGGIGLKFYMLMYLDHLQNWLVYGYGLLIFLILALFWLSETGQILGFRAFPGECMEEMVWNFARRCILTTFRTD